MFLSWWRGGKNRKAKDARGPRKAHARRLQPLWFEQLEDRTLPSTFKWLGSGADANWSTAANWSLLSGAGSFPNAAGDIAQFTGTAAQTTVVVNQAITVGEIDFATASNITIAASGSNVLTLDNTGATNAILDVGQAGTNSGVDLISAPVAVASGTPLSATITGGTLQLTNTGATPSVIGATSTFRVNSGGTLRESAVGTGSLVTGNLTDVGALGSAAISLQG